jgi:type VI protein secretion system component VasF
MKEPQFKERYDVYQEMKKRLRQLNQEENEEALSARLRDVRKRVKNLIKDTRSSPIKEVAII